MYRGAKKRLQSDFLLLLWMQTIRTLTPKSADIFVNSYYLNPIFFVMTAFLGGYENRFLSGYHCSAAPSLRENNCFPVGEKEQRRITPVSQMPQMP